ncbi:MAG: tRNA delta(2)-isopentenylpyrophosphate transferase [Geobacteraceae bacterium]|jgi:tRNA dimethylallyltransferase|nr:tRNA delta(2)-isopentenylpyrophosphate transferase [Geobacteraceae bacterium]
METEKNHNLIVILGPTASGKTRLAARLAARIGAELISADSRQVYRGMDIGTGKDLAEYIVDGVTVPCHLIDVAEPGHLFSVFEFQQRFYECFREIGARGRVPVAVGGTGLYIESVLREYRMLPVPENAALREELEALSMEELAARLLNMNPALHNTTDLTGRERLVRAIEIAEHTSRHGLRDTIERPDIVPMVIGVRWDRAVLRERITKRLKERLDQGMIEEVRRLRDSGVSWERLDEMGLEYRYVSRYLRGEMSRDEMFKTLNIRIHQFAKRQDTWFRGMERRGITIRWIEGADEAALRDIVENSKILPDPPL